MSSALSNRVRLVVNRQDWAGASLLVYRCEQLHKLTSLGKLERRKIRGITSRNLANLMESGDGTTTLHTSGSPMVVSTLIRPGRSLGRNDELIKDGEETSLDLPLSSSLDLMEKMQRRNDIES
jgi:hypothetical protein